jgi:hypothetical protein
MKLVFLPPLVVILSALLGYGVLRATGWQPYPHEMMAACIPNMLAGAGALLPAIFLRSSGQAAVVQAAFQGMIIHMGATLGFGAIAYLVAGPHGLALQPFAMWMSWFFFVTLTAVSVSLIRVIRSTPALPSDGAKI